LETLRYQKLLDEHKVAENQEEYENLVGRAKDEYILDRITRPHHSTDGPFSLLDRTTRSQPLL